MTNMWNGYGDVRDELLNGEAFYSQREAQIIIERWRNHYSTKQPHSVFGYRSSAPEVIVLMDARFRALALDDRYHLHCNGTDG